MTIKKITKQVKKETTEEIPFKRILTAEGWKRLHKKAEPKNEKKTSNKKH